MFGGGASGFEISTNYAVQATIVEVIWIFVGKMVHLVDIKVLTNLKIGHSCFIF